MNYNFPFLLIVLTDSDRFVLGTDEGLFCLQLSSGIIVRVDSKKIFQVEVMPTEQLIVVISGKQATP